jgi:chromosome segregation ATPase
MNNPPSVENMVQTTAMELQAKASDEMRADYQKLAGQLQQCHSLLPLKGQQIERLQKQVERLEMSLSTRDQEYNQQMIDLRGKSAAVLEVQKKRAENFAERCDARLLYNTKAFEQKLQESEKRRVSDRKKNNDVCTASMARERDTCGVKMVDLERANNVTVQKLKNQHTDQRKLMDSTLKQKTSEFSMRLRMMQDSMTKGNESAGVAIAHIRGDLQQKQQTIERMQKEFEQKMVKAEFEFQSNVKKMTASSEVEMTTQARVMQGVREEFTARLSAARKELETQAATMTRTCDAKVARMQQSQQDMLNMHSNAMNERQQELVAKIKEFEERSSTIDLLKSEKVDLESSRAELKSQREIVKSELQALYERHQDTLKLLDVSQNKMDQERDNGRSLSERADSVQRSLDSSTDRNRDLESELSSVKKQQSNCQVGFSKIREQHETLMATHKQLIYSQSTVQKSLKLSHLQHAKYVQEADAKMKEQQDHFTEQDARAKKAFEAKERELVLLQTELKTKLGDLRTTLMRERGEAVKKFSEGKLTSERLTMELSRLNDEKKSATGQFKSQLVRVEQVVDNLREKIDSKNEYHQKHLASLKQRSDDKLMVMKESLDNTITASNLMNDHFRLITESADNYVQRLDSIMSRMNGDHAEIETLLYTFGEERQSIKVLLKSIPQSCKTAKGTHPSMQNNMNCKAVLSYRSELQKQGNYLDKVLEYLRKTQAKIQKKMAENKEDQAATATKLSDMERLVKENRTKAYVRAYNR